MEQQPLKEEIKELFIGLKEYFETKYDIARLSLVESTAIVSTALLMIAIVAILFFALVLFLSLALAFYLGEIYNSNSLGFLCVAGGYFVLTSLVMATRNIFIRKPILKSLIMLILPVDPPQPDNRENDLLDE